MSARLIAAFVVALAVGSVLACNRGSETTAPPGQVMLTGCLQPGEAPDTYQLAWTAAPSRPVGTRGSKQETASGNATGTAARSGTSDLGVADTRLFTLVAGRNVDLGQYQGALVTITGRVEKHAEPTPGTAAGSTGQSLSRPAADQQNQQNAPEGNSGTAVQHPSSNPTTGVGPQSSVLRQAPNRPEQIVRVQSVQRVAPNCATSK